ncbi:transporter substrate-binding domain-containing protein [Brevibacillus fulvus]|uniref:Polar amino acid transport system substrate-binding protein n=1 Tax=Brevibacillus fulvus TaxID=1125967 RepID=A0A938Y1E9_9BACL|nr:transporter substrate-binding domain-containing protein [Brevibacillus fulvus]MBM7590241.1 polar amino acid transport system substrate-binding protein [Brevibacillus fulvus]
MKKALFTVLSCLLALTVSACGSSGQSQSTSGNDSSNGAAAPAESSAPAKEKYVFGTDATYPPFEFEKDGKYVGIDIDLLNAIAEAEGFEIEIKPMDFKGIIPGITSKQLDGAAAGISITDERKQVIDFSEPYYQAGLSLVVRADNETIKNPEDLKGKTIAIKKGTTGAKFAEELAQKYGAEIKYFDDSPAMFQEVVNGNADVTLEDYPVVSYKIAVDPNSNLKIVGDRLNGDYYGIGVAKGNEELLKKINDGLKKVQESGKYDEIIKTYLGEQK